MKISKIIITLVLFQLSTSVFAKGVIISNTALDSAIDRNSLQRIFLGKQKLWADGSSIHPCYLETKETESTFSAEVVNKTDHQFSGYWTRKMFSGGGTPPRPFESADEILTFVSANKGAICYVTEAPEEWSASVKVLMRL